MSEMSGRAHEFEVRQLNSDLLVFVDVDRTVLNTDYTFELIMQTLQNMGVSKATIADVKELGRQNVNNAFDYLAEINRRVNVDTSPESIVNTIFDGLDEYSIDTLADNVLADGTHELIAALQTTKTRALFLTAGGIDTQRTKLLLIERLLMCSGMDLAMLPWVIISNSKQHKTVLANQSYDRESRTFDIQALLDESDLSYNVGLLDGTNVEEVIVLDDKSCNTQDVDQEAIVGVLVERAEKPTVNDSSAEKVGTDAVSLHDVAEAMYTRASYTK